MQEAGESQRTMWTSSGNIQLRATLTKQNPNKNKQKQKNKLMEVVKEVEILKKRNSTQTITDKRPPSNVPSQVPDVPCSTCLGKGKHC